MTIDAITCFMLAGPDHDKIRHNIGIEYELLLEQLLDSMSKCSPMGYLVYLGFH